MRGGVIFDACNAQDILNKIKEIIEADGGTVIYQKTDEGKIYIKEVVRQIAGVKYTTNMANEVIAKIQADTFVSPDEFFNQPIDEYVPVKNGLLNTITKQLEPFTAEKIYFNKLPVEFKPEANCPNFKQHIKDVLDNEENTDIIQEFFGSILRLK